jgi:hypothetical protein
MVLWQDLFDKDTTIMPVMPQWVNGSVATGD